MKTVFKAADLVLSMEHHRHWKCRVCRVERMISEAEHVPGRAPVCECGEFMCPVHPDTRPS